MIFQRMCSYFGYFLHPSSIHNHLCWTNRYLFFTHLRRSLGFQVLWIQIRRRIEISPVLREMKINPTKPETTKKSIRLSSPPFLLHVAADFLWVHWSVSKPQHEKCSREGEKISVVFWHTFRRLITTQLKCTDMCIIAETFVELHV